jgi:mannose-6-phosphate isomerase-like protein (cupin superfamily)
MDYFKEAEERRKAEEKAARDYWALRVHWAPFQGRDKLPNTIKIGGTTRHTIAGPLKPWKPETDRKPTKTQAAHVEMAQRVFTSLEGFKFTFWSLAPIQPGIRSKWQNNMHCEFVWLILDGTNGRGVHHALIDPETSEVRWWDSAASYYMPGCEEVAAS